MRKLDHNQAHILIIDDDPVIRLLASMALKSIGFQTTEAGSGEEGLSVFKESSADAILLDVIMPNGMDGFATCAKLRKFPDAEHIPILMMTGLDDLDSVNYAFEVGATDFITKPINIPLLGHRVRFMLMASTTTRELKDSERRLHHLAYFDTLTGLPNRQFFQEHIRIMVSMAKRQKIKLAVLFLDLDGFKRINDTLGHHMGDLMLKATSDRLRNCLRLSDTVTRIETDSEDGLSLARLGGDEFTVLLTTLSRNEDSAFVAERIRLCLAEPYIISDQELYSTTSIGISTYPEDGETADELLKHADLAMYYAKRDGGDRYRYFSNEMTKSANRRLVLENHLRKAIELDEFDLQYQPQIDLLTGNVCGVEALIRWNCQALGVVSPAEFIPLSEETGLIINIGEWVLRKACYQTKKWQESGTPLTRMAINISSVQLLHKGFISLVAKILSETSLDPRMLELEVTESALIENDNSVLQVLQNLKDLGITLAIDDFGTGYSSLSRLMNFPIDRLKIDQMFVSKIGTDSANAAIVVAVIAMAQGMEMKVIAEGVETEGQMEFLKNKFCNEVQGYLFSKPLTAAKTEEFLLTQFSQNQHRL